ncbi:MAG: DNA-primase RepB domain-containing protein [Alphaproteobacteria bacterium]
MNNLTPNIEQTKAFLQKLAPDAKEFDLRTFADNGAGNLTRTFRSEFNAETIEKLTLLNQQGAGIFVTINESDGNGIKSENIKRVRAFFADFDKCENVEKQVQKLIKAPLRPDIIVQSSSFGLHAYWLVQDDAPLDEFKLIQQSIAKRWNSDSKICDLPRIMRLPGFFHQKSEPFLVKIIEEIV